MLCPSQSPRNKAFEHRQMKEKKYCSGVKSEKYKEFILYYAGNQKIVLDLPDNFVKMVQNGAPRKVFLD